MALGLGLGLQFRRNNVGGFNGLFDQFGYPAFGASMRLLGINYTGGLVRVRAFDGVSDQGTADVMPYLIGSEYWVDLNSTLENLDATATGRGLTTSDTLADLVDAGGANYDGFVTTWFDQSGNANHATQATAANQPLIVSGGSIIVNPETNKPALSGNGSKGLSSNSFIVNQPSTKFIVGYSNNGANNQVWSGSLDIAARHQVTYLITNGGQLAMFSGRAFTPTTVSNSNLFNKTFLGYFLFNGGSSELGVNGNAASVGSVGSQINDGYSTPTSASFRGYLGYLSEDIFYPSNQSADKIEIEKNINNAFSIY